MTAQGLNFFIYLTVVDNPYVVNSEPRVLTRLTQTLVCDNHIPKESFFLLSCSYGSRRLD